MAFVRSLLAALLLATALVACGGGPDVPPPPPPGRPVTGEVVRVRGRAEIGRAGAWRAAALGDSVQVGDAVRTGAGEIDIRLGDSLAVRAKERTALLIERNDVGAVHAAEVRLDAGTLLQRIDRPARTTDYRIRSVAAGAVVRGTWFSAVVSPTATRIEVAAGEVVVRNEAGGRAVAEGEATEAAAGERPPSPKRLLDAEFAALKSDIGSLQFYAQAITFTRQVTGVAEGAAIEHTLEAYRIAHRKFPATLAEADWHDLDQWGNPYVYRVAPDGQSFTLGSNGPDRAPNTPDDVRYK